jgi:hypothetical protein
MTKKEIAMLFNIDIDKVRNFYKDGIRTIRNFMLKNQNLAKDAMALLCNE